MSQYVKSPFKASPQLAVAGTPSYLLGSYNDKTGPTVGLVISDSGNGTTSTVVFQIIQGNVPVTGSLVTIVGTANAAGAYNVTNVSATVSSTTAAGICTITFAGTGNSASAADNGQVIIPQPEVGETVTNGTVPYASVPVARPFNNPNIQEGQSLTATLNFGTGLSAVTAYLQGADIDLDSEYQTVHEYGPTLAAGIYSFQSGQDTPALAGAANPGGAPVLNYRFYRFYISAATGSGVVIGKIEF
jgi:hypothetical protein